MDFFIIFILIYSFSPLIRTFAKIGSEKKSDFSQN